MNGTTSLQAIDDRHRTRPRRRRCSRTTRSAAQALQNGQIDGLVVDLPTAFYMTGAQLTDGKVVGQLARPGGDAEQLGLLLAKDSPLTACVTAAVDSLRADGTLDALTDGMAQRRQHRARPRLTSELKPDQHETAVDRMATPHAERQQDDWQPSPMALQRKAFRRRRTIRSAVAAASRQWSWCAVLALLLVNAPGWPRLRQHLLRRRLRLAGAARDRRRAVAEPAADGGLRDRHPDPGAGRRADPQPARAGVLPAAGRGDGLRRPVPRAAADPGAVAARLRHAEPAARAGCRRRRCSGAARR